MIKGIENIATKDDITGLRNDISKLYGGLLKWVFIFGATQIIAIYVLFYYLLKR